MSSSATSSELPKGQYPIPSSPVRPKQLPRSITEVSPPSVSRIHHRHYHHHPHLHRSKEPQSAHPNLQPSFSHTRERSPSNEGSQDVSRKGSIFEDEPKRQVTERELEVEMERGALRASELRNSVLELNALSNNMTRRLDNTYYNVLEKLSVLRSTIISLKELASMTRAAKEEFNAGSEEVIRDITGQLEAFEGFTEQEKRINALKARVVKGREQIKTLGERVDVVKERVNGWEQADLEWQEKTRKRLNILWTLVGIVASILVAIKCFQYLPMQVQTPHLTNAFDTSGLLGKIPEFEAMKHETWRQERKIEKCFDGLKYPERENALGEEDPRLQVFDEL